MKTWKESLLYKVKFFFVLGMQCLSCYGLELELYLLLEQQRETCWYITVRLLARFLFLVWTGLKLLWHMWKWNFANIRSYVYYNLYLYIVMYIRTFPVLYMNIQVKNVLILSLHLLLWCTHQSILSYVYMYKYFILPYCLMGDLCHLSCKGFVWLFIC